MNKTCRDITALNLVKGLGPVRIGALIQDARDTEEIFTMSAVRFKGITGRRLEVFNAIRSIRESPEFAAELAYIESEGIKPLCCLDGEYPEALKNIYDPPPVLFYRGELKREDANAVAMVGSRRCSLYGIQMAEKLAFDLAERGVTVISGMARGIDVAAHRGALKAGGRTVAVLGSGFRNIYPPGSGKLMSEISGSGAVLTEYSSDTMPHKGNFPRRNRIISGMARGVVVVEAARKSGALITADFALEHGREVFAVPGRADMASSRGTNTLIQNGAKLVMNVDDILEELDISAAVRTERVQSEGIFDVTANRMMLGETERGVLDLLDGDTPVHIDRLSYCSGIDLKILPEVLTKLEIKGLVKTLAGQRYISERTKDRIQMTPR